jgi:hypothetical protein
LREALAVFEALIINTLSPDSEQLREIHSRLEYLANAVDRLNRFDWRGLALTTVIGVATTLSADTQTGRQLWGLFVQAMKSVGHLLQL